MPWLTNCFENEAEERIKKLLPGSSFKRITIGNPKPTKFLSVKDMKTPPNVIVGLYGDR
jgi:hypothetical protein